jgi:hypothetical protein
VGLAPTSGQQLDYFFSFIYVYEVLECNNLP